MSQSIHIFAEFLEPGVGPGEGLVYTFFPDREDAWKILSLLHLPKDTVVKLPSIRATAHYDGSLLTISYAKPLGIGHMTTDYAAAHEQLQRKIDEKDFIFREIDLA